MVSIVTAEECDVTHPLYGYKSDIRDALPDRVPGWAFVPPARCMDEFRPTDTEEYLAAAIEEYQNATVGPDERFDSDVTATGYGIRGKPDAINVTFRADPDATYTTRGGEQYHMPRDMRDRLKEIRRSSRFKREFDGHHVRFRDWEFEVTVGPRGGIQDVDLYAWGKG